MGSVIFKPLIKLRKEWGAATVDETQMFRYKQRLVEVYYRITLHHGSDMEHGPRNIGALLRSYQNGHIAKGWGDVAYHYLIDQMGRIWQGRSLYYRGVHVGGANTGNLGVCFMADGRQECLTREAQQAAVMLLAYDCKALSINPDEIRTHQEYGGTVCPGPLIVVDVVHVRETVRALLKGTKS